MNDVEMRDDYVPTALESMRRYWKRDVRKTFWILTALFVVLTALFTTVYADDPWTGLQLLQEIPAGLDGVALDSTAAHGGVHSLWPEAAQDAPALESPRAAAHDGWSGRALAEAMGLDPVMLFFHNLQASGTAVLLGLAPFLFLPLLALFINAVVLGAALGSMFGFGMAAQWAVAGILPHGIFELPALLLSFALGFTLCRKLTARICRRRARPLRAIGCTLLMFVLFVLPLLAVAAAVECWVTPDAMLSAMGW